MRKTRDTFKNIGDTKGGFQVQIDTIKERKDKDLTEAEEINKRGKNTEKNYTKTKNVFMTQRTTMVWSLT